MRNECIPWEGLSQWIFGDTPAKINTLDFSVLHRIAAALWALKHYANLGTNPPALLARSKRFPFPPGKCPSQSTNSSPNCQRLDKLLLTPSWALPLSLSTAPGLLPPESLSKWLMGRNSQPGTRNACLGGPWLLTGFLFN